MARLELYYPVKPAPVHQGFGENPQYYSQVVPGLKGHNGIDFVASHGQPVRAAHDGICYVGVDSNEGHGVVLRTLQPYDYNAQQVYFKTIYWHLCDGVQEPQYTIPVQQGQQVKAGDIIGYADNTGLSTGDHLHFGQKPQAQDESNGTWMNVEQDNGYFGAVDPTPDFNGFFAEDILSTNQNLSQQLTLAQIVVTFLKQLFTQKKTQ